MQKTGRHEIRRFWGFLLAVVLILPFFSLNVSAENEQQENSGENAAPAQQFEQKDPVTGIAVQADAGVFPEGTRLTAVLMDNGTAYEKLTVFFSALADDFRIYSIGFAAGSEEEPAGITQVYPQGDFSVQIPVPENYDLSKLSVYYIGTDGTPAETEYTQNGGTVMIVKERPGIFALIQKKVQKADLPAALAMTEKVSRLELDKKSGSAGTMSYGDDYSGRKASPPTGDGETEKDRIFWSAAFVLSIVCMVLTGRKKTERK